MDPDYLNFGKCCACEATGPKVRNIIMIDRRALEPGLQCWGCVVCGLEMAGAIAVLCDRCLESGTVPVYAVVGAAKENRRVPMAALTEPFRHDMAKHAEDDYAMDLVRDRYRMLEAMEDEDD